MENLREKITKSLITFGVAFAVGLTGCGGGGGDDDETDPVTFDGTSSGTVAKGIIKFGTVTAEELDVNGNIIRSVGTAQTDASGDYTLDIGDSYAGGVIRLTLSADGTNTTMVCDVQPDCAGTTFGESITLSSSFSMTALIPPVNDGASVSAQITPFSHMAASLVASGSDGFTSDAVKNATSEMSQMVGVDILNVPPIDITDATAIDTSTSSEVIYSAFTAGVGALMFQAADLTTGLQQLADTFADGLFDSSDPVSIFDIIDSVELQADYLQTLYTDLDLLLLDQVLATIEAELTDSDGDGILDEYDPEATDTATLSAIDQAKGLVSEVRTLVTSIEELESPARVFRANLETTSTVIDYNAQALVELTSDVIRQVMEDIGAKILNHALVMDTEYEVTIYDSSFVSIGTVSVVVTDSDGLSMTVKGDNLLTDVSLDWTAGSNLPVSSILDLVEYELSLVEIRLDGTIGNTKTLISYSSLNMTAIFSSATTLLIDDDDPLSLTVDPSVVVGGAMSGGIAITDLDTDSNFSGNTTIELVAIQSDYDDTTHSNVVTLSEIALDGEFSDTNNTFTAGLGLTVHEAASIDFFALLEGEVELLIDTTESGDPLGLVDAEIAALPPEASLVSISYDPARPYEHQTCGEYTISGDLFESCVAGDPLNTHDYFVAQYPDALNVGEFYVEYTTAADSTAYSGRVDFAYIETAESYVDATLTAMLNLVLDGYPDTTAVVKVDRTALDAGSALVTLTHDGNSITFNAELIDPDDADAYATSVTVTNPDGVALVVTGLVSYDTISGELTVDGVIVGTLYEVDNVLLIRYEDGSFETLY